ncbi:MAG: hypothetical protein CVU03_08445 [Bacteroidetes bacterium HGW-Bacteroidetes-2]|jgi:uncharacterized membrane protein YkvA (DUF1232 family)|nr:MAG: hypothetical protein CVU03_08445 [Bacteroidetes bacterium HGW-Bacteroidetes-2]
MNLSEENTKNELHKRQKRFKSEDIQTILKNKEKIISKFLNQGRLKNYLEDFKILFSMVKDYAKGKYKTVPWYIISSIGASLLYILSPMDLIPDFIPFIGYVDDAAILTLCLNLVKKEVETYKGWKESIAK